MVGISDPYGVIGQSRQNVSELHKGVRIYPNLPQGVRKCPTLTQTGSYNELMNSGYDGGYAGY